MKKKLLALTLTAAMTVSLAACGSSAESGAADAGSSTAASGTAQTNDVLTIQDDDWEGMDLFQVSSWNDMQSLVADSILGTDPETKEATPNIASESVWSDDGLTWTLTFPEGMYYSTGEEVEPEDFIASVEYGKEVSEYADGYANIESMEVDGRNVIVHLSEYQADMEYNFESCFVGMIDKDEIESMSKDEMLWGCHPYGAYYLDEYEPGAYVVLKANPGYKTNNPFVENKGACPIQTIKVVFSGESFTFAEGIQNGEYDVLSQVPMEYYDELCANPDVTVTEASGAQIYYAEMNMTDPILSDINVRKAIIKGMSRDNLSAYMDETLTPAYSLILSKCLNYSEDAVNYYKENYDYDPDEANRLLDEAGWKDSDGDGIREKDGTKLSFTFDDRDTESAKAIGQSLQIDMKAIGIDMQITTQDWSYVNQDVNDGNFQMAYLGLGWSEPFLLLDMFCQRNAEATNPDPDGQAELVAEARKIVDFEDRTAAITEIQKKIMDYCTLLPFADSTSYRVWRSEINGIKYTDNGGFWLNDVVTDANGNFLNVG